MKPAKILSLNVGGPALIEWNGRSIKSSMHKKAIPGPLVVHMDRCEGDSFASPNLHGTVDSVVYAYGMKSLMEFMKLLGRDAYEPGALGENLTLDELDENEISVGDTFQVGEVLLQASFPRIPCAKVDIRMEHSEGRKLMQQCGRSGVYFRVLTPGLIQPTDEVVRVSEAKVQLKISSVYHRVVNNIPITTEQLEIARKNGALPSQIVNKWSAKLIAPLS